MWMQTIFIQEVGYLNYQANEKTVNEFYEDAIKYEFPKNFIESFMEEQMIDRNTAMRWIGEYKKFITLAYFSNKMITPSEEVDQVWHMHMTYTKHYRIM